MGLRTVSNETGKISGQRTGGRLRSLKNVNQKFKREIPKV